MSTYEPIASQTLGSAAASVTFSSIPQGYTDLVLIIQGTHTSTGNNWIGLQYNGDTGTTYSSTVVRGDGSSVTSSRNTNDNYAGRTIITSSQQSNAIYQIQNYSNSTTYKTCLARSNGDEVDMSVGLWRNTAAIATVTIVNIGTTFSSGTTFSLYGIAAGAVGAKAAGGIVTADGTYVYHTFTSSGIFMPYQNLTTDYLVVGGGGGGAGERGGGGGAGGYRTSIGGSPLSVTAQSYLVTVGAGGAGAPATTSVAGTTGSDSIFSTITSAGGGGGGGGNQNSALGKAGGSGGGGGGNNYFGGTHAGGAASPSGQGNAGGYGDSTSPNTPGGGGGGAGAAGTNATTTNAGNGGNGLANSISGSSVTYAGGGGGGAGAGTASTGGTGGGGNGKSSNANGDAGTVNTGGGGGAGGSNAANTGGAGGSGIVIIRYAI